MKRSMMLLAGGFLIASSLAATSALEDYHSGTDQFLPPVQASNAKNASIPLIRQEDAWKAMSILIDGAADFGERTSKSWEEGCAIFSNPPTCQETVRPIKAALMKTSLSAHGSSGRVTDPFANLAPGLQPAIQRDSVFFNGIAKSQIIACPESASTYCIEGNTFRPGAMIARLAWYPVVDNGDAVCPLPVNFFDPLWGDPKTGMPSKPLVLVTPSCTPAAGEDTVNLDQFFAVEVTDKNKASFRTVAGSPFPPNAHPRKKWAVVVGFHLIQKVQDFDGSCHWQWFTFWWSKEPKTNNPSTQTGFPCTYSGCQATPWNNYVMASTSMPGPNEHFLAIVNPYVDIKGTGTPLNCIACHSFAMTPTASSAGNPGPPSCGAQNPSKLTPAALDKSVAQYATSPKRVPTDMIWAIARINKNSTMDTSCP